MVVMLTQEFDVNMNEAGGQVTESVDDELQKMLHDQKTRIKVVGVGGAGNNTISRLMELGVEGYETLAINTDAQDLLYALADKKILIGKDITRGLGAGSNPHLGEEAAKENEQDLKDALLGADMVFITCGMGGGTGTGALPVVASVVRKLNALCVAIVTVPFEMEGNKRMENAKYGIDRLQGSTDTLIIIPNDKLLELVPDVPIATAFKVADEILGSAVKSIADLITKPGLVNLDFADIKAVMGDQGGLAMIGVGESDTDNRAQEAVEKAINNPLLDVDINGAQGALVNIFGGMDLTLDEARKVLEAIQQKMDPDARIIWGAQIEKEMKETLRVMLIVTGVNSSQIFTFEHTREATTHRDLGDKLEIEFITPKNKKEEELHEKTF